MYKKHLVKVDLTSLCPGLKADTVLCFFCVLPGSLHLQTCRLCTYSEATAGSSHCLTHGFREKLGEVSKPVSKVAFVTLMV